MKAFTSIKTFFLLVIFTFLSCSENHSLTFGDSYCKVVNSPNYFQVFEEVKPNMLNALNHICQDELGKSFCDLVAAKDWKAIESIFMVKGTEKIDLNKFFGEVPKCKIDTERFADMLEDIAILCPNTK